MKKEEINDHRGRGSTGPCFGVGSMCGEEKDRGVDRRVGRPDLLIEGGVPTKTDGKTWIQRDGSGNSGPRIMECE